MSRCAWCGLSYSSKVLKIHQDECKKKFYIHDIDYKNQDNKETHDEIKQHRETANTIDLSKSTKTDLMLYILSESKNYDEDVLNKMLKKDLFEIATPSV